MTALVAVEAAPPPTRCRYGTAATRAAGRRDEEPALGVAAYSDRTGVRCSKVAAGARLVGDGGGGGKRTADSSTVSINVRGGGAGWAVRGAEGNGMSCSRTKAMATAEGGSPAR
eukprot:gene41336-42080_t